MRNSNLFQLILVPLLLLNVAAHGDEAHGMEDLTHLTFDQFLKSAGDMPVLVEFYAPWCSHCQRFAQEYKQVQTTLRDEVHVTRVDGALYRMLRIRFRVKGFPTFFLIRQGSVWRFIGPRTHDSMVQFARSGGQTHGELLDIFGGPLGSYWKGVTALFHFVENLRVVVAEYEDRPFTLVGLIFLSVLSALFMVAVVIHIITTPRNINRPPRVHTE